MKRILITGSSGFLGRYLLKLAPSNDLEIFAQYRSKIPESYGKKIKFIQQDFLKSDRDVFHGIKPDVVIHSAAMASIDECEVNPEASRKVNYEATCRLADISAEHAIRFIFVSSDVIFDGKQGNYDETADPSPQNVYAKTKVAAEKYLLENHPDFVIVRPGLFYGFTLNGRPSFTETILKNLYSGKQVFLFKDQYRTPLSVSNLAYALWELAGHDFTGVINLGGPERLTRFEMGEILCELFKLDPSLLIPVKSDEVKLAAFRPLDCSLNTGLAQQLLRTKIVDCRTGFSIAYR